MECFIEEWAQITNHPHYLVSNFGRVRSQRYGRFLKPYKANSHGHLFVRLGRGHRNTVYAHRAVAEAFIGPRPFPEAIVRHLDDDPTNNHLPNLKWGTRADNVADAIRNGRGHQWTKKHAA